MRRTSIGVSLGATGVVAAVLVALAGPAEAQRPTAVAEARHDVNGDGRPDVIRIESPAALTVSITGNRKANAWKPFTTTGKLASGTVTLGSGARFPGTVILATARFGVRGAPTTTETMVLLWRNGTVEELWRGVVGARGIDVESNVGVEVGEHGLLKYEGRPGVERCDGKPAMLFLERYDWKRKAFRSVAGNLVRVDPKAPRLVATRTAPPHANLAPPTVFRRAAASSQDGVASASELSAPTELGDGDATTAWREGAAGDGRGEFVTVRSAMPEAQVGALRIVPGDASSREAMGRSNRLRKVAVLLQSRAVWIDFPKDPTKDGGAPGDPYWVLFDPPVPAQCVTLIVDEVYPGGNGVTAIAELAVLTADELAEGGPYPSLAARVAAGGPTAVAAARTLARGGEPGARALVDALGRTPLTAPEATRLRRALAMTAEPIAVHPLVAGLAARGSSQQDRADFGAALARIGAPAVEPLAVLIASDEHPLGGRIAAAAALGAIDSNAATMALIGSSGVRHRQVRRAIGLALATPTRLWALLEVVEQRSEPEVLELAWRAIGHVTARLEPGDARARVAATATSRLEVQRSPVTAADYALRSRMIEAAAGMPEANALAAAASALSRLGDGPEADAIRRVTMTALGANPHRAAMDSLVAAAAAADPGVRRRVAAALGERDPSDTRGDAPLTRVLATDPWPSNRRTAAGALTQRCSRPAAATALYEAVDHDADEGVAIAALAALVGCRPSGLEARLIALAGDRARPAGLRARACASTGQLGTDSEAAARLFERVRSEVLGGSGDALPVAAACATGLGGFSDGRTLDALLRGAHDAAFPEIQAAAAEALGRRCEPRTRAVLSELRGSPQRQVSLAAKAAFRRCFR